MVGSAAQLSTYSKSMAVVDAWGFFPPRSPANALLASFISGIAVIVFFTPFDVISTRLYNQGELSLLLLFVLFRQFFSVFGVEVREHIGFVSVCKSIHLLCFGTTTP